MSNKPYNLQTITEKMLAADSATIITLIQKVNNPNFILGIMPFYVLFVEEAERAMGYNTFTFEDKRKISDIRNSLKIMQKSSRQSAKEIRNTDLAQDDYFRSKLRFSYLMSWNIHDNLGISLDKDYHPVCNTQLAQYRLGLEEYMGSSGKTELVRFSSEISSFIGSLFLKTSQRQPALIPQVPLIPSIPFYVDLNTTCDRGFFTYSFEKEVNLQMLHILCDLNFVKLILSPMLPQNDMWSFRIKYLIAHYSVLGFKQLANRITVSRFLEKIRYFTSLQGTLFVSDFRNCMMHYGLTGKNGVPQIDDSYINLATPFYGLVETHYAGRCFSELSKELDAVINDMILFLEQFFFIDTSRVNTY